MKVFKGLAATGFFSLRIQVFWSDRGQIEIWSSAAEIPNLAVKSTAEEWLTTGIGYVLGSRLVAHCIVIISTGCSATDVMH